MKKKIRLAEVAELIVVVGFVCFAIGSMIGGGRATEQYLYGENIDVNVSIPKLGISEQVRLYKGMTAFDAVLKITSIETTYYEGFGSILSKIGGEASNYGYEVNGKTPLVGMVDYQLHDGDNLEIIELQW